MLAVPNLPHLTSLKVTACLNNLRLARAVPSLKQLSLCGPFEYEGELAATPLFETYAMTALREVELDLQSGYQQVIFPPAHCWLFDTYMCRTEGISSTKVMSLGWKSALHFKIERAREVHDRMFWTNS